MENINENDENLLTLDEIISQIKQIYRETKSEQCESCRYLAFAKKMQKLNYSTEILSEILLEIQEQEDFELKRWTKTFKPTMTYVGSATLASYISNWVSTMFMSNTDFGIGLIILVFVFLVVYAVLGGIIIPFIINFDVKRTKTKLFIRFLQKYIKEVKINSFTKKK